VAAAVLVLVLGVIAAVALTGSGDDSSPSATPPPSRGSSTPASTGANAQAAAMREFVTTYLATVTSDQHESWDMLTTGFQKESGGFGKYQGFWRTISSATPHDVTANPDDLTVTYGVDYVKTDGGTSSDQVTLQLVRDGSSYLINGEA
jgi:hypothetical protein